LPGFARRRAVRVVAIVSLSVLSAGVLAVAGIGYVTTERLDDIPRVPAFGGISEDDRPTQPQAAEDSLTVLLVGSDSRSESPTTGTAASGVTWSPGAQRTDTIMLVHVPADRSSLHVVSLPRDTWVPVPGHGHAKINAAYSWGGPPLLVQTVEDLTDVRVDHVAIVDFTGFRALTDAVGGVDVTVPETVHDPYNDKTWRAGTHHVDGEEALLFVRQRAGLARGDLDRIERQQEFLSALSAEVVSADVLTDPFALDGLLDAVVDNLTVDDALTGSRMRDLALSMRDVRSDDISYTTAPISGPGWVDGQSILRLDSAAAQPLFDALRHDRMEQWTAAHGD
jgi:LCP family protein required for cell wall assembly